VKFSFWPWFRLRVRSFGHALLGVGHLVATEWNFRIHLAGTVSAFIAGLILRFGYAEWLVVGTLIGLVLTAEALNTAIERLVNLLHPEIHPLARAAKDTAAAGVLLASLTALIVGTAIVIHHLGNG
jgi:diacylglycerol kinase (ATP)